MEFGVFDLEKGLFVYLSELWREVLVVIDHTLGSLIELLSHYKIVPLEILPKRFMS